MLSLVKPLALIREVVNAIFNNLLFYYLLGLFSRGYIKAVFVTYPASEKIAQQYTYGWRLRYLKWQPLLSGIYRQNGKWGLIFTVPAGIDEMMAEANHLKLQKLIDRLWAIKKLVGAEMILSGGAMSTILARKKLIH